MQLINRNQKHITMSINDLINNLMEKEWKQTEF